MDRKQKIIIFTGAGIVVALIIILIILLTGNGTSSDSGDNSERDLLQARLDSLEFANDRMRIDNLSRSLDSLPNLAETKGLNLESDEVLEKYNAARNKIEGLMAELKAQKNSNTKERKENQEKIRQLEEQIGSLKNYCKDLLQRLDDLNVKYEAEVQKNTELTEQNRILNDQVSSATARTQELSQQVAVAERLNLTSVWLNAYNKKGKQEKKVAKASQLGVGFTISPNNTAKPGMKDFYIRIKSPEGTILPGNGTFQFDGKSIPFTARRQMEYANDELKTVIYWDATTSLTPGDYTVEIFCDGNCLKRQHFNL